MIYQGSKRYPVNEVMVHAAATRPEWMSNLPLSVKVKEIRRWHVEDNKWRDIGYHWIIDRDGSVAPGRAENQIGAGCAGRNNGVIHICLIGGHGSSPKDLFEEHFTAAQDVALRMLIEEIQGRTKIKLITGHNQYANKACPGFHVPGWFKHKPVQERTSLMESETIRISGLQMASGAGTALGGIGMLDGNAQIVAIIAGVIMIVLGMWFFRERKIKWDSGDR